MPKFEITAPDGRKFEITAPEGATQEQALEYAKSQFTEPSGFLNAAKNIGMGALKGASDIGTTLLYPVDKAVDIISGDRGPSLSGLVTGNQPMSRNEERRATLGGYFADRADTSSLAFKGGELASDIAGTAGVGGAIAKATGLAKYAPRLAAALESGGFRLGGPAASTTAGRVGDAATRAGAGAVVGGASAGLVNPDDAGIGAGIGAVLPGAVKAAGAAGRAVAPKVSDEVGALYQRAKDLGIEIPLDRITNSRPMNALAASLNYVPLSGRAATEERMVSQMNRALSRTFGQDSDNVTAALRKAQTALGDKFEVTLNTNKVKADDTLMNDLVTNLQRAERELGTDGAGIIGRQVDEIMAKVGADGLIDGQAAYNIKKALDRISGRNSPEAWYANQLKKSLMGALDRSLGPQEAAKFAKVRQQYGNMLDLENIALNGAEGGVSIGRLANMKGIGNDDLQELADIAGQFIKSRENPHGAAQRVMIGSTAAALGMGTGSMPLVGAGMVAGRAANSALNMDALKRMAIEGPKPQTGNALPALRSLIYQAGP